MDGLKARFDFIYLFIFNPSTSCAWIDESLNIIKYIETRTKDLQMKLNTMQDPKSH